MLHLVGNAARALTLTSGLFGSLTVLPLYFLARQLYSDKVATLTALLLSSIPCYGSKRVKPIPIPACFF